METYAFMKKLGKETSKIQQYYIAWAKKQGVNYNILAVLYVIYKNGKCLQKNISDEWSIPKQTVNATCKSMLANGLIKQEKNDADRREIFLSFTEKGKELAVPIVESLLAIESGVLNRMGEETTELFLQMFSAYADYMEHEFTNGVSD